MFDRSFNSKQDEIMQIAVKMSTFIDIRSHTKRHSSSVTLDKVDLGITAIITDSRDKIISIGRNMVFRKQNPCLHAEVVAIARAARRIKSHLLLNCNLYVTLEPCAMCAFAISLARLKRLYIKELAPKTGAVISNLQIFEQKSTNWKPEIYY